MHAKLFFIPGVHMAPVAQQQTCMSSFYTLEIRQIYFLVAHPLTSILHVACAPCERDDTPRRRQNCFCLVSRNHTGATCGSHDRRTHVSTCNRKQVHFVDPCGHHHADSSPNTTARMHQSTVMKEAPTCAVPTAKPKRSRWIAPRVRTDRNSLTPSRAPWTSGLTPTTSCTSEACSTNHHSPSPIITQ